MKLQPFRDEHLVGRIERVDGVANALRGRDDIHQGTLHAARTGGGIEARGGVELGTERMRQRLSPIEHWAPEAMPAVREALLKAPDQKTAESFAYGFRDIAQWSATETERVAIRVKELLENGNVGAARKEIDDTVGRLERAESAHSIARP